MDMARYLDLFLAESAEHLASAEATLVALEGAPDDGDALRRLFRHVHSLKGMAATMGFADMVGVAHALEDLLDLFRGCGAPRALLAYLTLAWEALACLGRIVDAVREGRPGRDGAAAPLARRLRETAASLADLVASRPPLASPAPVQAAPLPSPRVRIPRRRGFRVELDLAPDMLPDSAGAVRLVRALGDLGEVVHLTPPLPLGPDPSAGARMALVVLTDLDPTDLGTRFEALGRVRRFTLEPVARPAPLADLRPTPAHYVRVRADLLDALMQSAVELTLAQGSLAASVADPETARLAERCRRVLAAHHETLMELRLVPFETVAHRLTVGVQDLAKRLGKTVQFTIAGREVRLDRSVLDALVEPLLHVVRNALDHGVEDLETRIDRGKPGPGTIRLTLARSHDRVRVTVEDDGRGLDPEALRRTAIARGFLTPQEADRLGDDEAFALVTLPGFTTALERTEVSGRGVGMDVVRDAVEALGGRVRIRSRLGTGTTIEMDLPQTLAVIQALVVRSAGTLYAVPISAVDRTLALDPARTRRIDGRTFLDTDRGMLELGSLAARVGAAHSGDVGATAAALLSSEPGAGGVLVDEVLGRREILVRPLDAPLRALRSFTGAAILEDGSTALVVDPAVMGRMPSPL